MGPARPFRLPPVPVGRSRDADDIGGGNWPYDQSWTNSSTHLVGADLCGWFDCLSLFPPSDITWKTEWDGADD